MGGDDHGDVGAVEPLRGEAEARELHNWNFDTRDGVLHVWGPYGAHDLTRELADVATTTVRLEEGSDHAPWVCAVLEPTG